MPSIAILILAAIAVAYLLQRRQWAREDAARHRAQLQAAADALSLEQAKRKAAELALKRRREADDA